MKLIKKMQIEVIVSEASVDGAIKAIMESAKTGEIGDPA